MTTVSAAPVATDQFMHTPEFKRHFVELVHVETLMALRLETKGWNAAADALIDELVRSGELIVHGGNDFNHVDVDYEVAKERHTRVTRMIFLLNVTKVGDYAANLVVVDIPEGVKSIGHHAFNTCSSLTTVSSR